MVRTLDPFRDDFDAAVAAAATRDGFDYWEHSVTPFERALDALMADLSREVSREKRARCVLACAELAYPVAFERGAEEAEECDLGLFVDNGHDPTALTQLGLARALLDAPSDATLEKLRRGIDETRQLQVWDDDIRPDPGHGWHYMTEVADLLLRSIKQTEEGQCEEYTSDLPVAWPAAFAARRAVVCAHKVLVAPEDDAEACAKKLIAAIAAAAASACG